MIPISHLSCLKYLTPFASGYETISMAIGTSAFYFLIITIITSKFRKKIRYQRWRKLHVLNPVLYILVTLHGLISGTDFQGTVLAIVNGAPIIIIVGMLLSTRKKLAEVH